MPSIDYLRSKLLAAPEPFEYRLFIDPDSRGRLLAAMAERDNLVDERDRLTQLPPEARRARSISAKAPAKALDDKIAAANEAVERAEAEAEAVILRWFPQDPDERDELVDSLSSDGRGPSERVFVHAQTAATFAGAFTSDGTNLGVTWDQVIPRLNTADKSLILAGVRALNDEAHGAPFSRASFGRPATSSSPA